MNVLQYLLAFAKLQRSEALLQDPKYYYSNVYSTQKGRGANIHLFHKGRN